MVIPHWKTCQLSGILLTWFSSCSSSHVRFPFTLLKFCSLCRPCRGFLFNIPVLSNFFSWPFAKLRATIRSTSYGCKGRCDPIRWENDRNAGMNALVESKRLRKSAASARLRAGFRDDEPLNLVVQSLSTFPSPVDLICSDRSPELISSRD